MQRRVAVCGSRVAGAVARTFVYKTLDDEHARSRIDVIMHGRCPTGVDPLVDDWAATRGVACMGFRAAWEHFDAIGKENAAGPVRNRWILGYGAPTDVIAFAGGNGTKSMCELAHGAGLRIRYPRE